ncbi:hypothetical protein MATL_G00098380 [Megalops atlanticus]|uniref:Uncharacterized protein n=1 Tax=Megalops atlanticus TaxID=7932 RepID=A0A9D3T7G4_MEGAT|nr:hypothetical protein MATL_G00098380 [Megalops atlanticus]
MYLTAKCEDLQNRYGSSSPLVHCLPVCTAIDTERCFASRCFPSLQTLPIGVYACSTEGLCRRRRVSARLAHANQTARRGSVAAGLQGRPLDLGPPSPSRTACSVCCDALLKLQELNIQVRVDEREQMERELSCCRWSSAGGK